MNHRRAMFGVAACGALLFLSSALPAQEGGELKAPGNDILSINVLGPGKKSDAMPRLLLQSKPVASWDDLLLAIRKECLAGVTVPKRDNPLGDPLPPQLINSEKTLLLTIPSTARYAVVKEVFERIVRRARGAGTRPDVIPVIPKVMIRIVEEAGPVAVVPGQQWRGLYVYVRGAPGSKIKDVMSRPVHVSADKKFKQRDALRLKKDESGAYGTVGKGSSLQRLRKALKGYEKKTRRGAGGPPIFVLAIADDVKALQAVAVIRAVAKIGAPVTLRVLRRYGDGHVLIQDTTEPRGAIGLGVASVGSTAAREAAETCA